MKPTREYNIAFVGLKPGLHTFNYTIDDRFFEIFEKPEFTQANIEVKLNFDKKPGTFHLHFHINGSIKIACDRCGDDFEMTLWDEFELVVKQIDDEQVERKSSIDTEVAYIGKSESMLDVSLWIYEFIVLSVPIQRIHADDKDGNSQCNPIALNYLKQQEETTKPKIWDGLKNRID